MFGYWQAKNLRSCFKNFHLYYDHLMIPLFTKLSKCNYLLSFMIDHCMIEKYQPNYVLISVIPVWLNHFHVSWMIEKPSKLSNCINHFLWSLYDWKVSTTKMYLLLFIIPMWLNRRYYMVAWKYCAHSMDINSKLQDKNYIFKQHLMFCLLNDFGVSKKTVT